VAGSPQVKDVKFTSLRPVLNFHFCVACQEYLLDLLVFLYMSSVVAQQQIDWPMKMKRCKGCSSSLDPLGYLGGRPSLEACGLSIYPDCCKLSMDDVRMLCTACARPCMERLGTPLPKACCAPNNKYSKLSYAFHVKQLSWRGVRRSASSSCIKHQRRSSQGLNWHSWTFHRSPLLLWLLRLTLLVMLQSVLGVDGAQHWLQHALISTQTHVFLTPKHHQYTSIMLLIDIGCWNWGLEGVGF